MSDTQPPTIPAEFSSISSNEEKEAIISNLIIEELPDNFISDKKEQNVVDYEILSKSSDGNISDNNFSSEISIEESKKRNADDDDLAEAASPPVNSKGGLVIEEVQDVENIGKEKIEHAAIIEEVESYQSVDEKGNAEDKFRKSKKRKIDKA